MRNAFINQLLVSAREDKSILLITGDLGYGVVDKFANELPDQFLNFGINEQSMMGAAAGLASKGFRPFVYSIGNFPTFRCLEQVRNDVCHMNLDVCIVSLGAGFCYGTAGYSHHLIEDISALSSLPNVSIYSPADTLEIEQLFPKILKKSGPSYLRLGKGGEGQLTQKFQNVDSGISILAGSGELAILTTGNVLSEVISAAGRFPSEVQPTIVSVSDFDSLGRFLSSSRYRRFITVEEHVLRGGFGSMVLECLSARECSVTRMGIKKLSGEAVGSQQSLRKHYEIDADSIFRILKREIPNG